ncbi:MAG TPA: hypothetical protein VFN55_16540 [Solirubrobacteraceae bacterium]|nr:hypothetical protein [Solirubrobacteraceae bacterium]
MSVSTPHAHRFRTATAVLVGFAIGAILIAVALAVSSSGRGADAGSGPAWSPWHPPDSGTLGARDIADYIAPSYRIDPLNQLAVVTVVNLESANAAAAAASAAANGTATATGAATGVAVAIHPSPTSSAISLLGGNTIAYNLCGIGGKNCAIGVGTPSASRLLLLRREALELALYTFRYLSGVQNVVTILPPGHTVVQSALTRTPPTTDAKSKPLNVAVLFDRKELAPLLSHPLSELLPESTPPSVSTMAKAPEAPLVEQVTGRGMFSEQLQQAQDGSNLIVLDPLPPQ